MFSNNLMFVNFDQNVNIVERVSEDLYPCWKAKSLSGQLWTCGGQEEEDSAAAAAPGGDQPDVQLDLDDDLNLELPTRKKKKKKKTAVQFAEDEDADENGEWCCVQRPMKTLGGAAFRGRWKCWVVLRSEGDENVG